MRLLLRLVLGLLRLPLVPAWWVVRWMARPRSGWVLVRLQPRLTEMPRHRSLLARWIPGAAAALPTPLESLRRLATHVGRDPRMQGIVLEIPPLLSGWGKIAGLRDAIARVRDGVGDTKRIIAYLPRGGRNKELYLATVADRIVLGPQGTLGPLGLSIEAPHLRPLLDSLGVEVQAVACGEYKTALEPVVRASMSDRQREQLQAVLQGLDGALGAALRERRGSSETQIRDAMQEGLLHGASARRSGLVDAVAYEDDLARELGTPLVTASRYRMVTEGNPLDGFFPRPYVAIVEVHGLITETVPRAGIDVADLDRVVTALRSVARDRLALGLVVHIDSRGGSAVAADFMHHEVARVAARKPVVACLGDVAASGGYYVAAAASSIVAQPTTITGSIGVVAAKLVARGLLDRIGVRTEALRTAPHADMLSPARALEASEEGILQRQAESVYRSFIEAVARGRDRSTDEIESLARGRIWTGAEALEGGLVDELGDLGLAIDRVRARAHRPKAAPELQPRLVPGRPAEAPPPLSSAREAWTLASLPPQWQELACLCSSGTSLLSYAPVFPPL